ncbi:16S rRNA (cytosine(1402)-N(4))-methyltransferase RsmH [Kordiimonas marina]|uniref:16S rRNA (cytosine(1402)-N(4))-methyltransferase RsmH n=1 Tax=Kordiimonas marina TaxID=2872312 RepID=UPI001FF34EBB|nr:16S rRNA (cytosine(1402)-N(4))-methyltransferase RsmH [Kordiimonas marina]MCJ9429481.1 16S rRNA (cytosine(1402)-N(4))-methyltransferase RsmH [Kordiimonas marina]
MSVAPGHRHTKDGAGQHIPVMLAEVLATLDPKDGEIYVDGTFGAGGYTRAILEAADCTVYAIDRDPDAIRRSAALKAEFGDRFHMLEGCFGDMASLVRGAGIEAVNGVVLDIGVSSFQLDEAERGFSFMEDGPLDMRMARSGESAADVVNTYDETALANLIYQYGEEKKSRRVAAAIVRARDEEPITRTRTLASIIERTLGIPPRKKGMKAVHPATRTFQALRIHVNDELGELQRGLEGAEALLAPEGRLVIVAFHSLEDRMVKQFMTERAGRLPGGSRHLPQAVDTGPKPTFELRLKGAKKPGAREEAENPRSRSARLRQAIRTAAPAWKQAGKGGKAHA